MKSVPSFLETKWPARITCSWTGDFIKGVALVPLQVIMEHSRLIRLFTVVCFVVVVLCCVVVLVMWGFHNVLFYYYS